ncbi:hypothetical protein FYJ34_10870 [Clostridiaceae bacterium 68-1-5]|uniref:Uncharacterized protein n=1 Tax=Suipraeoptans intestinalis TaxID=2606628 RepID=A0A6N7V2G4_9FIRM|nr:hypothetical protein [Suipraeoptans intestinalis]MSR94745.1 hypothetical protein [Suipraeoptans intestinalis]
MGKVMLSKTESLFMHNRLKERLAARGIAFEEEAAVGAGIKEMIKNILVFQRPSSGVRRSESPGTYTLWIEEEDSEKARLIKEELEKAL